MMRTITTLPTKLFLGIPNTLNVVSVIPFFFIGLAGLILNHCESYFRLCSQRALYTLFFAALLVSVLLVLVHSFTISTRKMTPYFGTHCQRMILVQHQLKLTFMVCLLVPKMICLWVPKLQGVC